MTTTHDYLFDIPMTATISIQAADYAAALALLESLNGIEPSIAINHEGANGTISELSIDAVHEDDVDDDLPRLPVQVDGDNIEGMATPVECRRCQEFYDEARGDGYNGLCPSCADATEPKDDDD